MKIVISILLAVLSSAQSQFPFSFSPELTASVKEAQRISSFVSLWEFSLRDINSSQRTTTKTTLVPRTLIVPDDLAMVHLIPQDGSHPLYLQDKKHSDLRREFILSHLVLEKISPMEPLVSSEGITATTLSGRSVLIRKDELGELTVEGVKVLDVVTLSDGIQIYRLRQPLFNLRQKVKDAFDIIHGIGPDDPIGPPLLIPESLEVIPQVGGRSPAPPPQEVKPPAIPPLADLRFAKSVIEDDGLPPAIPPVADLTFTESFAEDDILPPAIPAHFTLNDRERSIVNRVQPPK